MVAGSRSWAPCPGCRLGQPPRGQECGRGVCLGAPGHEVPFQLGGAGFAAGKRRGELIAVEDRKPHPHRHHARVHVERTFQAGPHGQVRNPQGVFQAERAVRGLDPRGRRADIGPRRRGAGRERLRVTGRQRDGPGPDERRRGGSVRQRGERLKIEEGPVGRGFRPGHRNGDGGPFGGEAGAIGVRRETLGHAAFEDADQLVERVALFREDPRSITEPDRVQKTGRQFSFGRAHGGEGIGPGRLRARERRSPPRAPLAAELEPLADGDEGVVEETR